MKQCVSVPLALGLFNICTNLSLPIDLSPCFQKENKERKVWFEVVVKTQKGLKVNE